MIRVQRAAEPAEFDAKVRQKGKAALKELIGSTEAPRRPGPRREKLTDRIEDIPSGALPPFWVQALPELRAAYRDICAYLGMYIDPATGLATVDHRHCPFMAHELHRQGRLRPADRESTR
ncbi:hypothetical protein ACSRUE_13635 [Sorangium sp. KYC3313]|uniref:hypothetical protein n=1 Tax=Sorangium sp. KYC3313 TaxID=3449740 RepID=UPI003F888F83